MNDFLETKRNLQQLIDDYQAFIKSANRTDTSEETIRGWINKMLEIFGWNVLDTNQVLQEKTLGLNEKAKLKEIESRHSRPDYSLVSGKIIKVFLDAKDLDVDLFTDNSTAFQVRSYAWSAGIPCSFASNFEQFIIFDCRFKPNPTQAANYGAIQFHFLDYLDNFEKIYEHLHRDNVKSNHLERMYDTITVEGKQTLDANFNVLLTDFRLKLASSLLKNNSTFSDNEQQLNFYVQVILDRLIFVRVCESRGIEQSEKLKSFKRTGFWNTFKNSCYMEFYEHYDGAMFERDKKFQEIILDDDMLGKFVDSLYYPHPYKFDVIPVKIIAQIYEDFLSRQLVIRNGNVREELKSEYVKEKGAISTPQFMIEAICKNTLELDKIESINELLKIKILDPSCGSGAFLVVCFELISQRLVELQCCISEAEKNSSHFVTSGNKTYLTVEARRKIIKNCLYGVDVDEAAIEVSKMSLALKVIDDNDLSILEEIGIFGNKILHDIHSNIRLGNTLVDTDISLAPEAWQSIKPFDVFEKGFFDVFKNHGGFDFVVGNPPYVETKHYKLASPSMHEHIKEKFISFEGKADLAIIFIERCLSFLNENGRLGFIVQKRFFKTAYGAAIRQILADRCSIKKIIDLKTDKLFPGRMTYVAIMILTNSANDNIIYESIPYEPIDLKTHFESVLTKNDITIEQTLIPSSVLSNGDIWAFESYKLFELISHLSKAYGVFGNYPNLHIKDVVQVLWKKAYHLIDCVVNDGYVVGNNGFGEKIKVELAATRPIIYNRLFYCFMNLKPHAYAIFPYEGTENKTPIKMSDMEKKYPLACAYLVEKEQIIKENVRYYNDIELWHTYTRVHNHDTFFDKKIIIPMTAYDTIATCSLENGLYMDNANVWFVKVIKANDAEMKALTSIINSTVFSVFAKATANPQSGGYYKFNKQFLFPVPFPSKNIAGNRTVLDKLALLYDEIVTLQHNFTISTPTGKDIARSALEKKWEELDKICYELYELDNAQTQLIINEGRTMCRVDLMGGA